MFVPGKPSLMLEGKVNAINFYLRMSKSVCLWQASLKLNNKANLIKLFFSTACESAK